MSCSLLHVEVILGGEGGEKGVGKETNIHVTYS